MACGCPNPSFKESIPIQSLLELSGSFELPTDIVEPDILLGLKVAVISYPDYAARRFNLPEDSSGIAKRYLQIGYLAFGIIGDCYLPEIPIEWDKSFFIPPPHCTHLRYWLYPNVQIDIDSIIGTCPEDDEL